MPTSLATLLVKTAKATVYNTGLAIASSIGVPVSSWQAGDPMRALFHLESEFLTTLEELVQNYVASGFLDHASGIWLEILADQVYGVTVPAATQATTDCVLTNSGGALYTAEDLAIGSVIVKNSTTDKTYRNATTGVLNPSSTLTLSFVADEAGSDSTSAAGDIDELVTGLLGVTVTNPTAAIGVDKQDDATTRQQCRDKLGALSPNGPADAYSYVARSTDLTTVSYVPRVRVYSDSDSGDVTVYLASPSGTVSAPDLALFETAILKWATPLCITPSVLSCTPVTVPVTYTLWVYQSANKTAAEIETLVEDALEALFAAHPIGGDIITTGGQGYMYKSLIESTIRGVLPQAFRVSVSLPAADVAIAQNEVAALGTVTATVNLVVG